MTGPTGSPGPGFLGSSQPTEEALAEAGQRINKELNSRPSKIMTFSGEAGEKLLILHADYLDDLGVEAIRIARRNGMETVNETHVIEASKKVGGPSSDSKIITAANTIGSVAAGAGIASIYTVVFDSASHTKMEQLTGLTLCLVGFVLLTIAVTASFLRR